MRTLKSFFALKPRASQRRVEARMTAVIAHVIHDVGVKSLVNGNLSLDKKFRPRFNGALPRGRRKIIAMVSIGELDEGALLRSLVARAPVDPSVLGRHTGSLVSAVMREFTSQSPAFRSLPSERS